MDARSWITEEGKAPGFMMSLESGVSTPKMLRWRFILLPIKCFKDAPFTSHESFLDALEGGQYCLGL